jgi:sigma-E factor negative regulatory protein RseC
MSHAYDAPSQHDLVEGTARVVALDGESVWLEPEQTTSCGTCVSATACGAKGGNSARWLVARRFLVRNTHGLGLGERVVVGISEGTLLRASVTAYGLPLVALMGAGLVAKSLGGGDAVCAAAGWSSAANWRHASYAAPRPPRRATRVIPGDRECRKPYC